MNKFLHFSTLLLATLFFSLQTYAQVSGTVFRDINGNGCRQNSSPSEPGIDGIIIKAYDRNDILIATVSSASNGIYNFTAAQIPASTPIRLECMVPSSMPALNSAVEGSVYGSAVQYVTAPAVNINAAFNSPKDYVSTNDVTLFNPLHWSNVTSGDASTSEYANRGALLMFKESYTGIAPKPDTAVRFKQVGVTWGMAMHKPSQTVFVSSFFRKWGSYGPGGQSAIYTVKGGVDGNLATDADNEVSTFVKLDDYFGINSTGTNAFSNPVHPNGDSMQVGKVAFGDIDMSVNEDTLFAINLHDRRIYKIPVNDNATSPALGSITASPPYPNYGTCNTGTGVLRPFGMAVNNNNGKVYVAASCENSSSLIYVFGYDPSTNTWDAKPIIEFTIGYYATAACCWGSWNTTVSYEAISMPQGIAFDVSGKFLALTYVNLKIYKGIANARNTGNIIRFGFDGAAWVAENGGISNGLIGFSTNNGEGPGGGEFYDDASVEPMDVSIMGGVLQIPGRENITATLDDPFSVYTAGVTYINNNNGSTSYRYRCLENVYPYPMPVHEFEAKKNALGDLEFLTTALPIEIGNRVWNDSDADGIQDADEVGMAGVEIELLNNAGAVIATVTTDVHGNYYFTSAAGTNAAGISYNIKINPKTQYTLRVKGIVVGNNTISGNAGLSSSNYCTKSKITGNGHADWSDNDGINVGGAGGTYQATITTGKYGQTNHNVDFGFTALSILPVSSIKADVTLKNDIANINWTTINEIDTKQFYVQFSTNNVNFTTIDSLPAKRNSSFLNKYSAEHHINNNSKNIYYRVKLVSFNGAVQYSNTVLLKINDQNTIAVWPNPFAEKITVKLTLNQSQRVAINLLDSKGSIVKQESISLVKGANLFNIETLQMLPKGTYLLQIITLDGNVKIVQKLVKE